MLLQVSCAASVAPVHTRWPAAHVIVPLATHAPRGGLVDAHAAPASTGLSSAIPSQISTPPLVLLHWYSQPSICWWLASTKPAAQSIAGSNRHALDEHDAV